MSYNLQGTADAGILEVTKVGLTLLRIAHSLHEFFEMGTTIDSLLRREDFLGVPILREQDLKFRRHFHYSNPKHSGRKAIDARQFMTL